MARIGPQCHMGGGSVVSTENNMAILFADKIFKNCNTLRLRQHTVHQSFSLFYPVQYDILPCHSTVLLTYITVCKWGPR
jgi:hypothetical protein